MRKEIVTLPGLVDLHVHLREPGATHVENPDDLDAIFGSWPRKQPILVHAEGKTLQAAIELAEKHRQRLHACHMATEEEILMVKLAKQAGLPVTCEVRCHHLFLTEDDVKDKGPFAVMRPPLATRKDQRALWDNLDVIDMIASDHAPHTRDEKLNLKKPPFGVPGLETTLPLMLTAVAEGRLTLDRLVELTSINPRRIFGLSENPETYTEVDLTESYVLDSKKLRTKAGWTPFEGMRVTGRVVKTVLRGMVVFDGNNVVQPAKGKVVYAKGNI